MAGTGKGEDPSVCKAVMAGLEREKRLRFLCCHGGGRKEKSSLFLIYNEGGGKAVRVFLWLVVPGRTKNEKFLY